MNLKPMPGRCFVEMDAKFGEIEDGIWIPEVGRRIKGRVGKCIAYTPWRKGTTVQIWAHGRKVTRPADAMNPVYKGIVGKYVIVTPGVGTEISWHGATFTTCGLEHIEAISEQPFEASAGESEVGRCQWCASKGEGNLMLDGAGYCVQCNRNEKGEHRSEKGVTVSDDEVETFGKTAKEYMEDRKVGRKAEKGTIFSYAGQSKRSV